MPEPIVFYDIPRNVMSPEHDCQAWSPNTWKARYALNIKGIPYRTVWVEYPDIEPLCKKLGVPSRMQRPDGSGPLYTLPAIYDPNTKATIGDSAAIVRYLDKTYPSTHQLIPKETVAILPGFQHAVAALVLEDLAALLMPASYQVLNPASQSYFLETREKWFGIRVDEPLSTRSENGAKHWDKVKSGLLVVGKWLDQVGDGRLLFGGDSVLYADVILAGFLKWPQIVFGQDSEEWRDVLSWEGGRWARFMEAFEKYDAIDVGTYAEV